MRDMMSRIFRVPAMEKSSQEWVRHYHFIFEIASSIMPSIGGMMSDKRNQSISQYQGGVFQGLSNQIKLILRLMADRRVNPLLKLMPVGALAYLFIPDMVIGPLDDALIIWLGTYLFVELCPPAIVEEHRQRLERELTGDLKDPANPDPSINDEEIVDAEYWEEGK